MSGGTPAQVPLPAGYDQLNRYSRIIVDEARARGIAVVVGQPELGELFLTHGGRTVAAFESLSELTSAVAFRRCDDKLVTRSVLVRAGVAVPSGREATFDAGDEQFLADHGSVVVKPARGEQGRGITLGVTTPAEMRQAVELARRWWPVVLVEEQCFGEDVRVVVIDGRVVAAAVRVPASVTGDGGSTVAELAERANVDRLAGGLPPVSLADAAGVLAGVGRELGWVPEAGRVVVIGRTANVHAGATITDVTDDLHPALAALALDACAAIGLPVAGVDLIVASVGGPQGRVIEVNEQPGLANHEPRPTVARFVDLLFPETAGG